MLLKSAHEVSKVALLTQYCVPCSGSLTRTWVGETPLSDAAPRPRVLGVGGANRAAVPCRPRPDGGAGPVGLDPDLDSMAGRERTVDRRHGQSLAAVGVRQADVASHLED